MTHVHDPQLTPVFASSLTSFCEAYERMVSALSKHLTVYQHSEQKNWKKNHGIIVSGRLDDGVHLPVHLGMATTLFITTYFQW
jgi:hypothetical protein